MSNTEETTTVETSTAEEAASAQTRPRKKTAARKQRELAREPRKQRPRRATKKITTAAAESRMKSRSREGSKADAVLELLRRKDGATTAEIAKATGWQNHTIRAFVSTHVAKKMGFTVESAKNKAGERFYRIIP